MAKRQSWWLWAAAALAYVFLYLPLVIVVVYSFNDSKLNAEWWASPWTGTSCSITAKCWWRRAIRW